MSDKKESNGDMRNRKISLAWLTAASAKYFDLGLTAEQRICLYRDCLGVALEHSDLRLILLCSVAILQIKNEEEESGNKKAEMEMYLQIATFLLYKEKYDDAILYCKKCLAIAQESGDKVAEMKAHEMLGKVYLGKEEYGDSISYSNNSLAIAQELGDKEAEMNAYIAIGIAHLQKEEYEDTISYSEKCLAIAQESGNRIAEMTAYMTIADVHLKKEEYDDAILYSKKYLVIAQESGNRIVEITAYRTLGDAHLKKEEYTETIVYSEKCLAIAQQSGDKVAEMKVYETLSKVHFGKEEHNAAILYSEMCLALAQESGDKVVEMSAYMTLVNAHSKNEENDDAISYSEKYLAIAQESGDRVAEMIAYKTLGDVHLKKEEYDNAISCNNNFLEISQATGHKVAEMVAHMALGHAYLKKKEYDDAISHSNKCLTIAQEFGDKKAEMNAYIMLGDAHLYKKEYDDGILCSKKYLAIAQELGYKEVEVDACMALKNAHFEKEEYDSAILYSNKCLVIAQESGHHKEAEVDANKTLGAVYGKKEKYDDAHSCFTEAMEISRDLKDQASVNFFSFCLFINGLAVGMTEAYKFVSTAALNQALRDFQEDFQSFYHGFTGYIQRSQHHEEKCDYKQAISCLKAAEAAAAQTHENGSDKFHPTIKWTFKHKIAEMYTLLGEYEKGEQFQQEALDIAQSEGKKYQQALSLSCLGQVYHKLEQTEKAEKSFQEALKLLESIFDDLQQNDRFKIDFVDKYKETYKKFLKFFIESNKKEEALVLSDRYRAKALKDLLVSSYGMKKEQIAKEDLQYADVQSLVSSSTYTLLFYSTCCDELCTFLVEAGHELEFSVQHFKCCDACLDKLVDKTFHDMKVRQVSNCSEHRSLDGMDDSEENTNPEEDELTQMLNRLEEKRLSEQRRCTCGKNLSDNSDESSLTNGLEILYHKLIQNIKCLIKQDEIVIIPEGPLCKVPFAALRDPDTKQYLSETKQIRMAPSMASLKLLQEYPVEHHSRNKPLIIGDPLVGRVMLDGVETEFKALEGGRLEAVDLAVLLGEPALLLKQATKPAVIKRLQEGASIVHIAAHGFLAKATIVLAPSPEIRAIKNFPDEEDYMLTMADVEQAQVRAQLVVLSCCYSGRGQIKAEGVIGMCRAFLASGARAVVGSLWAVDDEATWIFMETFYTYLKDGKSASTSLHLTMNDMRRTPEYSEPKYWAPFFLMGDDVTIQFED